MRKIDRGHKKWRNTEKSEGGFIKQSQINRKRHINYTIDIETDPIWLEFEN